MANTFALILVLATLITGLVWLLDRFFLKPRRAAKVQEAQRSAQEPLTADSVHAIMAEPGWVEQCKGVFPVLLVVLVLRSFVYEPFQIPSGSMMPTLLVGDFILVNKFDYGLKDPITNHTLVPVSHPKRGDIIVFKYPNNPSIDYIKRVIGLPGDKIIFHDKELFIQPACNGAKVCPTLQKINADFVESGNYLQMDMPLDEYVEHLTPSLDHEILRNKQLNDRIDAYYHQPGQSEGEWVVPAGHYFAMGDNRDNSEDSRYWGFVPEQNLVGKAVAIWMSFEFDRPADSWLPRWIPTGVRLNRIGSIQ